MMQEDPLLIRVHCRKINRETDVTQYGLVNKTMQFLCPKILDGLFDHIVSYSWNYEGRINIRLYCDKQRSAII
jgi:hypothetical protein